MHVKDPCHKGHPHAGSGAGRPGAGITDGLRRSDNQPQNACAVNASFSVGRFPDARAPSRKDVGSNTALTATTLFPSLVFHAGYSCTPLLPQLMSLPRGPKARAVTATLLSSRRVSALLRVACMTSFSSCDSPGRRVPTSSCSSRAGWEE